jgi:hypothetical protein
MSHDPETSSDLQPDQPVPRSRRAVPLPLRQRRGRGRSRAPWPPAGRSSRLTRSALERPVLADGERERRVAQAAALLVRTIRACPAPGVPPFRMQDWLVLGSVVVLPFLALLVLSAWAGR